MEQINMHEAKTHLSRYAKRVEAGEEIVVAKAGKPVMKLVPYVAEGPKRQSGFLAGKVMPVDDAVWFARDQELERIVSDESIFP